MAKAVPKSLVEAVQAVFEALEPFDDTARSRILQSATSLLGGSVHFADDHSGSSDSDSIAESPFK